MKNSAVLISLLLFASLVLAQPNPEPVCQTKNIPAATPSERFVDNGDGTIRDTQTDLEWKKCVEGLSGDACGEGEAIALNWAEALLYLNGKKDLAAQGWRIPNIRELSTIVESQCMYPAINREVFPETPPVHVWTSSPYHFYTHYSWYVDFAQGIPTYDERIRDKGLRLVRDSN